MSTAAIQQLLKENQTQLLRERRLANRTPFVRPVWIRTIRGDVEVRGFTRDLSTTGVGVICPSAWEVRSILNLEIHSFGKRNCEFKVESRWCEEYGDGWYVIGFVFR